MSRTAHLSTGHDIEIPARLSATIAGAVFPADREGVADLLPAGIEPIRATPNRAAVTLLAVSYDRVGEDAIAPYDEVAVLLPAVEAGTRTVPYLSALTRGVSGYVWFLPVTTEPAKAFGVEVWGYPKVVADIEMTDDGRTRRAAVTVDDEEVLRFAIARPRTVPLALSGYNYTVREGRLLRERTRLRGRVGVWRGGPGAAVRFGDHPRGRELAPLDIGDRPLVRVAADCEFVIEDGVPLER